MNFQELENFSVKIKNYKCFGEDEQGFDRFKPINIIIGRNNSGKSSLLEVVELATNAFLSKSDSRKSKHLYSDLREFHKGKHKSELFFSYKHDESLTSFQNLNQLKELVYNLIKNDSEKYDKLKASFRALSSDERHLNDMSFLFRESIISTHWSCSNHNQVKPSKLEVRLEGENSFLIPVDQYSNRIEHYFGNCFSSKKVFRINPDRDIKPEKLDAQENAISISNKIDSSGNNLTLLIEAFLNDESLNKRDVIQREFKNVLNEIIKGEAEITNISSYRKRTQQTSGSSETNANESIWEINLEEADKGEIPLSKTGNGIKTIIFVLSYLILLPKADKRIKLEDCIFIFEELENNLHPTLLKRLLAYIQDFSQKNKCLFFLSTHSNVFIDFFSQDENAQILHVTRNKKKEQSEVKAIDTYIDKKSIFDDLGHRASDLLQSNCLIWVEGISDKIYIDKWIELWSEGKIVKGIHYQCVFYGGDVRKHLTGYLEDDVDKSDSNYEYQLAIYKVNRNAIIVFDSDRTSTNHNPSNEKKYQTKMRVKEEIENNGGLSWETHGKTIENYITPQCVSQFLNLEIRNKLRWLEHYTDFPKYIQRKQREFKKSKENLQGDFWEGIIKKSLQDLNKTPLSKGLVRSMKREHFPDGEYLNNDLHKKMNEICSKICEWNGLDWNSPQ